MSLTKRITDILARPAQTWFEIRDEYASTGSLYSGYACILALIPAIAGFVGMAFIGVSVLGFSYQTPLVSTLVHAIFQYVLSLAGIYVVAMIVNTLAPHFNSKQNMTQATKLTVYSWTPSWVAGILMIIPKLAPLAALLSLYSLYLFYTGLPVLMDTPRERRIVYFIVILVVSVIVSILIGSIAGLFLPTRGPVSLRIQ